MILFLAATGAYLASAILYFRGHFLLAAVAAVGFWAFMVPVVLEGMGPIGTGVTLALLVALPVALLLVHAVDAKRGIFLAPTIYSIPVAFVSGVLLWAVAGLALVF